tara:strand:- start:39 stop:647 length:609 start_codon:yes stop_codon:yes gene_type:complete
MYKSKFYIILILFSATFSNTENNKTKNWYFLDGSGITEDWYFLGGSGYSTISAIQSDYPGSVNGMSYDIGFYWHYNQNTLYGLGMAGKSESLKNEEQNLRKKFNLLIPSFNLIHFKDNFGSGIFFRFGIGHADAGFKEEVINNIRDHVNREVDSNGIGYIFGFGYSVDYKGKSRYMLSMQYCNTSNKPVGWDYFGFVFTGLW